VNIRNNYEKVYYENPLIWEKERYLNAEIERAKLVLKWIPHDVDSILDVGCGNGTFVNYASASHSVVGVDFSWTALQQVKTPCCRGNIEFLPFPDKSFDIVTAMEVLEHLPYNSYMRSIEEIARVSKHLVLITVPYKERLTLKLAICPECGCAFHRWYHMRSFTKPRLTDLFSNVPNPLHMVRLEGAFTIKYIPFVSYPLRLVWLRFGRRFPFESICPQCGFKKEASTEYARALSKKADKKADFFKRIERLIPIKITKYRWWIALYKKNEIIALTP